MSTLNEADVLEMLADAITACEELLEKARDAHALFSQGDYIAAADALISARGLGFFDDDYHLSHVRHMIQCRKETQQ